MYTSQPITALLERKAELWLAERCTFSCQNRTRSGTLTVLELACFDTFFKLEAILNCRLSCIKKFHTWCYSAHGERGAEKWRIESRINKRPRAHCHKVQQCGYFFSHMVNVATGKNNSVPHSWSKYSRSSPYSKRENSYLGTFSLTLPDQKALKKKCVMAGQVG